MGRNGDLFASQGDNFSVLRYNGQTGQLLGTFVPPNSGLYVNADITFGPNGNLFGINHTSVGGVMQYDGTTGASLGMFTKDSPFGVGGSAITFGPNGDLFESSDYLNAVLRFDGTTGEFKGYFATGGGLDIVGGLAFGPGGNLYVGSIGTGQILEYNGTTGAYTGVFADNLGAVNYITFAQVVPEPSTLALSISGIIVVFGFGWRRIRLKLA